MPRAAVLYEYDTPFVIRDDIQWFPPTAGRLIVRTGATPFCSTDILSQHGINGKQLPTILGHASVGIVEEIGEGVTEFSVGQRVIVPSTPECGRCYYCSIGRPDQCSELFDRPEGFPKVAMDGDGNTLEGAGNVAGYAELMNLSEHQVWRYESDLPDEVPAMYGCGLLTGFGAVFTTAQVGVGESVVIIGAGHLGLWATQAARIAGASSIVVVEPLAHRRELAGMVGATHVVDPAVEDPISVVKALTAGRGADHAIEAAGPVDAAALAVDVSRRAGTIVLTGYAGVGSRASLDQLAIGAQSRRVLGCQNGNVRMGRDIPRVTQLLERGDFLWEPIVTRRYALDQINEARANCESRADTCGIIFPQR